MAKVRAAVLAAGRGVRMGGRQPKTLMPLGDDEPLLHYILRGLKKAGIEDLLVVTGFGADAVQGYVTEQWSDDATFVFNARWASWGNFHSVRMALDQSPGTDVLVVNSDVVVNPDVYKRTAEAAGDLALAVQRRPKLEAEDMRVELDGDRVKQISKQVKPARSHGEYTGVSLLRPAAATRYLDTATNWEWAATTDRYYEDVYNAILGDVDVRAAFVRGDEYAEVDTPDDVPAANSVIDTNRDAWGASQVQSA
ncbi:MAG: NTP transferase domain-containing protein [Actinobacteria bacterium]|nr:NTP transferase domain-containing protein [Actinomycetota bacterium]